MQCEWVLYHINLVVKFRLILKDRQIQKEEFDSEKLVADFWKMIDHGVEMKCKMKNKYIRVIKCAVILL